MECPLRILLIGDLDNDIVSIRRSVEQSGQTAVVERVGAREGLENALADKNWDVLVFDHCCKQCGSEEVWDVLKGKGAGIPLIVLTDREGEENAVTLMRHGARDYVKKDDLRRLVPILERELRKPEVQNNNFMNNETLNTGRFNYRQLFDLAQDGIWVIDADSRTLFVNKRMAEMLGYVPDEMAGKLFFNFMEKRAMEIALLSIERNKKKKNDRYDLELCRKDGERLYTSIGTSPIIAENGKYAGVIAVVMDISARIKSEEELIRNYQFLQVLIDTVPIPLFYKDNEGKFVGVNKSYESLFGIGKKELTGKTSYDIMPKEMADYHAHADATLFRQGSLKPYAGEVTDKDGNSHIMILHKVLYWNADGSVGGMVGIMTDVTEMKRDEKEREAFKAQLIDSNKIMALGQLAAGVAHELNNPMTIIMGNMQYLLAQASFPESVNTIVREVEQASQRCRKIVNNLLEFARNKGRELDSCSVNDIVELIVHLCAYQYHSKNIVIEKCLAPEIPRIKANVSRLEEVLLNIVSNAAQAIYGKGTIVIATRYDEVENSVEIIISDNGEGIEQEHLLRIYEPFYTTKKKGAGLGLSVSNSIIRQHGGKMRIESEGKGKGARVTIILPVNCAPGLPSKE